MIGYAKVIRKVEGEWKGKALNYAFLLYFNNWRENRSLTVELDGKLYIAMDGVQLCFNILNVYSYNGENIKYFMVSFLK